MEEKMTAAEEHWRPIIGFENAYEISSQGNVRSLDRLVKSKNGSVRLVKSQIKKQAQNMHGYKMVGLCLHGKLKNYSVHRLVAQAFIQKDLSGLQINHIDGNKTNNTVSNLEISNSSHNQLHAIKINLRKKRGKSKYNNVTYSGSPRLVKKWCASVRVNGKMVGTKYFDTEIEAAAHVDSILDSVGDTMRNRNFKQG